MAGFWGDLRCDVLLWNPLSLEFCLPGGLTFLHQGSEAGEHLCQRSVVHFEEGQLVERQAGPVRIQLGSASLLGVADILRDGWPLHEAAQQAYGSCWQGEPVGIAGLLELRSPALSACRHIAAEPVQEAMPPQDPQRPDNSVLRAPELRHEVLE